MEDTTTPGSPYPLAVPLAVQEEALERFSSMLEGVDFSAQLETLGIGRFQFAKRKEAKKELSSMYVGLWKLALNCSFPGDSSAMLGRFLENATNLKSKSKKHKAEAFAELCGEYARILQERGSTNFIDVALRLCQNLGCTDQNALRGISLQIALDMRAMYHHIFEHLI